VPRPPASLPLFSDLPAEQGDATPAEAEQPSTPETGFVFRVGGNGRHNGHQSHVSRVNASRSRRPKSLFDRPPEPSVPEPDNGTVSPPPDPSSRNGAPTPLPAGLDASLPDVGDGEPCRQAHEGPEGGSVQQLAYSQKSRTKAKTMKYVYLRVAWVNGLG
jgi:hypothetical protein